MLPNLISQEDFLISKHFKNTKIRLSEKNTKKQMINYSKINELYEFLLNKENLEHYLIVHRIKCTLFVFFKIQSIPNFVRQRLLL